MLSPDEIEIDRLRIKRDLGSILDSLIYFLWDLGKLLNFFEPQFTYL